MPEEIDDDQAVFIGDIGATAIYGAGRADIREGDTVAIVGAGPLGILTAQAAVLDNPSQVLVLERDQARLALAAKIGATPIDIANHHPVMAVADLTDGRGADVVIEAVGLTEAFESSLDLVRRGGRLCVLGVYASETIELQLGVNWIRGVDVRFAGLTPVQGWWEKTRDAIGSGALDPTVVISHRLPLDDAAEGYRLFGAREATKVVLTP